jgi:uncharacterized protein YydD (DUF2326 family)
MVRERSAFIKKQLPQLEIDIQEYTQELNRLIEEEKKQISLVSKSDTFEDLEQLINELNEKFRSKGEYENILSQINTVESEIAGAKKRLTEIEELMFSDEFNQLVDNQRNKFNRFFSEVSQQLYGVKFLLSYERKSYKSQQIYSFNTFNENYSTGTKQGEIASFDIAYIQFADSEKMPTLHFLLNDKKELMHGNQLVKIAELVEGSNIQFVASILKDKLPPELNRDEYIVLRLSQSDKLFRIESIGE